MIELTLNNKLIQVKKGESGPTTTITAASEIPVTYEEALEIQKTLGLGEDVFYFRQLGQGTKEFVKKFISSWSC